MPVLILYFIIEEHSDTILGPGQLELDSVYYRYRYQYQLREDSLGLGSDTILAFLETSELDSDSADLGRLQLSGVKDFFFDTNEGFNQGLSISMKGEVEGVDIEASLSDKAAPSQTMRIGDIEKMSLTAATKNFHAGIGTLTLNLPFGIQDEVQGGRAGIMTMTHNPTTSDSNFSSGKGVNVNAAYALNRGSYRRIGIAGEEGKQGPYFLEGAVVSGTERVYISQGFGSAVLLKRDEDYMIDYEQSVLAFTNRNIITSHARITVEYTEATSDYQKIFSEVDSRIALENYTITTLYRRTLDDRNVPLNFSLSTAEIDSLKNAGDSMRLSHLYFDTSSTGSYDTTGGHFVYTGQGNCHFNVIFFYTGESHGEYVYDPDSNGFLYLGPGLGNYSPSRYIPLPKDEQFYGISVETYQVLTTTLYGSVVDRNEFSSLDDEDNRAKGFELGIKKEFSIFSVSGDYLNYDRRFHFPRARESLDYYNEWNTSDTLVELARLDCGVQPFQNLAMNLGYGYLNRENHRRSLVLKPFFLYLGYTSIDTIDRYVGGLAKSINSFAIVAHYERGEGTGTHYARYGLRYSINKQSSIGFSGEYDRNDLGRGVTSQVDILSRPFNISLGQRLFNDTTFLFGTSSVNLFFKGITVAGTAQQTQSYSQKKDEAFVKVTEGTGTHVYDSTTHSYVPKDGGDYARKIVLLKDFERVTAQNYGIELGHSSEYHDIRCRFNMLKESNFDSHDEGLQIGLNRSEASMNIDLSQRTAADDRYVTETSFSKERIYMLNPMYQRLQCHAEKRERTEKEGAVLRETRVDYSGDLSCEFFSKPSLTPLAGYTLSYMGSDFFEFLDVNLQSPMLGLTVGYPVRAAGRFELNGELVYRLYNISDVPYFFSAAEPPGLTKMAGLNVSMGVGKNSVFSFVYRIQSPAGEKYNHNLRFQTRIRF